MNWRGLAGGLALALLLSACGGSRPVLRSEPAPQAVTKPAAPKAEPPPTADTTAAPPKSPVESKRGGYYLDDGPATQIPEDLDRVPDAEPKWEPLNRYTSRPYVVFGKAYQPHQSIKPFKQRGVASWYGKKFHGLKTASGERYDMFAMTAAHPVLPIPSYVRVRNPANGKSVVVRINDRGPFHANRIIDLSYTAAQKLGYIGRGSTAVEIEQILPEAIASGAYAQLAPPTKPAGDGDALAQLIDRLDTAPAAPPAGQPTTGDVPSGTYLQLGAFGNPANAENLRQHLARELDWLADRMRIFSAALPNGGDVHRLQAGPFASRALAEQAAVRVGKTMGNRPALVSR